MPVWSTVPSGSAPVNEILTALRAGLDQTGYEEVSLLSLSSSDYTNIIPLIEGLRALLEEQQVNITLPSLRIESFSEDLMDILQSLSPGGGFTIAPEAGTERLRSIINKPISDADLMETVRSVFRPRLEIPQTVFYDRPSAGNRGRCGCHR